jgi:AcrR family transcriptional regulator
VAKRTNQRDLILAAATTAFARFGYAKTTLEDVGRAVQLNKASLYYYFTSKDDLFMEVVLRESTEFQQRLTETVRSEHEPVARIRRYLIERLRYYRQVLNLHQLSLDSLQLLEPRFDVLYAQIKSQEVAFLAELLWPFGAPNADQVAAILLTVADAIKHEAIRSTATHALADVDFQAAETKILLLVDLILKGLMAPPA